MNRIPLYLWILLAMIAGMLVGPSLGTGAAVTGDLGKLVIQVIKAVATPLLFLAIVKAVLQTKVGGRAGLRLLGFALFNASVALGFGLLLSNLLQPGGHLQLGDAAKADASAYADKKVEFVKTFTSYIPSNFVTPFVENSVISIVILGLVLGFGLRKAREEQELAGEQQYRVIEDGLGTLLRAVEWVLTWAIKLIPIAVFGVVAKTVADYGFTPLKGLAVYVGVGLLGLALQVLVTYQLWLSWVGIPLRRFWKEAREPVIYAMGTNSSLATLPVTLKALERLGVSKEASTLGACVGTNLNNDGILLYEGMAVLFVAQASGIHLSFQQQLLAAVTSIVAAMGVAGVPEAGFISLALVLNTVGLPIELLPLLLTVDWVIARGRSVVNVLSDMILSILIDGRRATTG